MKLSLRFVIPLALVLTALASFVMPLVDTRMVLSSIHKFDKFYKASLPSLLTSDS